MNKVVKLALISAQTDQDGNPVDYKKVNKILWDLQRQTRDIKNKTIQLCWEYSNFSSEYYQKFKEYPKDKTILGLTLSGFIYDKLKSTNELYAQNLSTSIRAACSQFNASKVDLLKGEKSIISYKNNQPLDIHNEGIKLELSDNDYSLDLGLLNKEAKKKYNFKTPRIHFKIIVRDNSTKTILDRCLSGEYKITASKLIYEQRKKMWYLNLCYSFTINENNNLDPQKILGVDLGLHYPICASVYGSLDRFTIDGGEIENYRKKVLSRKYSLLKQGKNCGKGRIGHGIQKRNEPVYKIRDKIARFRDTVNHKYSRALIDYAVKNQCGVIQMEDLTGITDTANYFLKNWSYFDLQTKIKYKAEESGISIQFIKPNYTSQRCSKCGTICKENRPEQAKFQCLNCGFEENADYNASQNIGIANIDKIIEKELSGRSY